MFLTVLFDLDNRSFVSLCKEGHEVLLVYVRKAM